MPPRKSRLSRGMFNQLSKREIIRSPLFDISYCKNEDFRVACVISKKRIKLAVERNRVRRKAYHALSETGFNKPYIIIIYPRVEMLKCPYQDLVLELSKTLSILK